MMKKSLPFIVVLVAFSLGYKVLADEVTQKTDGAFVGDSHSFTGEDMQQQTDRSFAWFNKEPSGNNFFAGSDYSRQVRSSLDGPFAQDNSGASSDGVFIGGDTQKQTDGSEGDYGQ